MTALDPALAPVSGRWRLVETPPEDQVAALARDVARGLLRRRKRLSCRFLYDAEGSRLFERICELPEYYLTRAETEILAGAAGELAAAAPRGAALVELGAGSARKTRLLLDALLRRQGALLYVPIDVSRDALTAAAGALVADYPGLRVCAIADEYGPGLRRLGPPDPRAPRLVAWLGSSIGNLRRAEAAAFLARLRGGLAPGDRLLVGFDLRKERAVLEAAYDDGAGVTAAFNRNLLARINRDLGGRFDVAEFAHRARYREAAGRVELHLVSRRAQRVRIDALGLEAPFAAGEAIFTERSVKYSPAEITALARAAGLRLTAAWTDAARRCCLALLAPLASRSDRL